MVYFPSSLQISPLQGKPLTPLKDFESKMFMVLSGYHKLQTPQGEPA